METDSGNLLRLKVEEGIIEKIGQERFRGPTAAGLMYQAAPCSRSDQEFWTPAACEVDCLEHRGLPAAVVTDNHVDPAKVAQAQLLKSLSPANRS
jgi:hypothetical protein